MHIMEGYLPPAHAVGWTVAALPFVVVGIRRLHRMVQAIGVGRRNPRPVC